jgi:hypothetical protein
LLAAVLLAGAAEDYAALLKDKRVKESLGFLRAD